MLNNIINVAVDSGKHTTKAICSIAGNIQTLSFRSKMKAVDDFGGEIPNNNFLLEELDKTFIIGDMISENAVSYNLSKQTEEYKYCIYLAICLFLEKLKVPAHVISNINVAINMPLTLYKNETHKTNLKNFILNGNNPIRLKVNSKHYNFKISNAVVLPEAMGSVFTKVAEVRNKRISIIDIGGLNVSYTTYNNLTPQIDTMISSNNGIYLLHGQIAETLTTKYNTLVSNADVEYLLRTDKFLHLEGVKQIESKLIIEQLITEYVNSIFNFAKSRGFTFNSDFVLCGGGALLLKEYILRAFPMAIIEEDGQFSNVRSFHKILGLKYGQA